MEARVSGSDVVLAFLSYVPILNLAALARRHKTRFLLYHARQGLYLFSLFLVLLILLLGLFWVFHQVIRVALLEKVLAVLVVMCLSAYVVLVVLMAASVLQRRMVMLPWLGELAGER